MKKLFPFEVDGLKPARVIDSIKNEVRRYVKRERRKDLSEGVDFWDFDCRVGPDREDPADSHVAALNGAIDLAATEGWAAIYIEILAKPGHRQAKADEG